MGGGEQEVKETADQMANAQVAVQRWNDAQTRLKPMIGKFADDVTRDPSLMSEKMAGAVNADVAQATEGAKIDPTSGGRTGLREAAKLGTTFAKGATTASQGANDQQVAGLQAMSNLGRGQAVTAELGYSNLARNSVGKAISDAVAEEDTRNAVAGTIGNVVGTVGGLYKRKTKKESGSTSETTGYGWP